MTLSSPKKVQKPLPKPFPAVIACQRCGYDTDEDGACWFCGHIQSQK